MGRVGKKNVTKLVGDQAGVSEAVAGKVLAAILDVIIRELSKGNSVTLTGFGTWRTKVYKPRNGRNPQTGRAMSIPARTRVSFKPGSKLRELAESSIDPDVFFGLGGGTDIHPTDAPELLLRDVSEGEVNVEDGDVEVMEFFEDLRNNTKSNAQKKAKQAEPLKQRVVEPVWFAEALAQRTVDLDHTDSDVGEGGSSEEPPRQPQLNSAERRRRKAKKSHPVNHRGGKGPDSKRPGGN